MPPILLLVPVFELLGLLGFMYLASISVESNLRYLPFAVTAVMVVLLFVREAGSMTFRQLAVTAVLLSFLVVAGFQGLGFIFSGLAKDVSLVSSENIVRLAAIFTIVMVVHGSALAMCCFLRRHRLENFKDSEAS